MPTQSSGLTGKSAIDESAHEKSSGRQYTLIGGLFFRVGFSIVPPCFDGGSRLASQSRISVERRRCSVVGAVLATLLAIHLGFAMVILLAVLIYGLACAALRGFA